MTGPVLAVAVLAATSAWLLTRSVVRAPKALAVRVDPYIANARHQLGTLAPERAAVERLDRSGVALVFGPMLSRLADGLARLVDVSSTESTEVRLRQAGMAITVEQYRVRQLGRAAGSTIAGGFVGAVVTGRFTSTVLLACVGAFWGGTRSRAELDRRTGRRRERMRAELYTVCQLLAIYLRTGDTPSGAIERLTRRASGDVIGELADAATQIRTGSLPAKVFEQLTTITAEPAAGRLYRLLSSTWNAGGDPDALLSLGEDLRSSRREELQRTMAKRETAMALPLVMLIAPILILFVAAAIPHIVLGR